LVICDLDIYTTIKTYAAERERERESQIFVEIPWGWIVQAEAILVPVNP
jgi:hypothetical protein